MADFRTNFKDEIATRTYQIVDALTGAIIHSKAKMVSNYTPTLKGDKFGATEVNAIHDRLNKINSGAIPVGNSSKLEGKTIADIQKVERGTFPAQLEGVNFTMRYTKVGKIVEFEMDLNVGGLTNYETLLTASLPFDVYNSSGLVMAQVSAWPQRWCRLIAVDRRLVLYVSGLYENPLSIQGSVTCIIK